MDDREIKILLDSSSIKEEGEPIRLLETHISWVILTSTHAYKIKKPVKFSFLDFHTPELRKYYCQEELRLNRRLAPDIYLELMSVYKKGKDISFEELPGSEVVDHAVKMLRIEASRQMHLRLEKDLVTEGDIRSLANIVAHFHKSLTPEHKRYNLDEMQQTFNDLQVVADQFVARNLKDIDVELITEICSLSDSFLENHIGRLQTRSDEGFVCEGHGDLHTGNIFLGDPPIIFDCIEFSAEFRIQDVLSEIAFFCMDLEAFRRNELSALFQAEYDRLNPCLKQPEDHAILTYFKMYRANVRLKVNLLKMLEPAPENIPAGQAEISLYQSLLRRYQKELSTV